MRERHRETQRERERKTEIERERERESCDLCEVERVSGANWTCGGGGGGWGDLGGFIRAGCVVYL